MVMDGGIGMITFDDVLKSRERIHSYIYQTPLELSLGLSSKTTNIYLKLECQQRLKSFKVRGALSKMTALTDRQKAE